MADKKYKINFEMSDGSTKSVEFTSPQGEKGDTGATGADGITPHVGSNGNWFIGDNDTGIPATGPAGFSPARGTDYWTNADKEEMVNSVLAALPTWTGGSY